MSTTTGTGIKYDVTRYYANLVDEPDVQSPKLGTVYKDDQGNVYQFVKNTHTADQVAGYVGFRDFSGGLRTSVMKCATAALELMAGVWMSAVPTLQYGWIQCMGVYSSILFEGTIDIAIGDKLKGVNAQFYVVKDAGAGTVAAYQNAHIVALEAFTTDATGSKKGLIHCPIGV